MTDDPAMIATANHIEPVPHRIRAYLAGENEKTDIYVDGVLQQRSSAKSQGSP